jgi:hypothetical protein
MNIQRYAKKDIALAQIETALRLYFEGEELFSVVTLAGAAEEILGQLLRAKGTGPGALFRSVLEVLRPGERKRSGEGGGQVQETEDFIHLDARGEALFLLGRAIDDYHSLTGAFSAGMLRFNREARAKS